jgi:hypothetical protein
MAVPARAVMRVPISWAASVRYWSYVVSPGDGCGLAGIRGLGIVVVGMGVCGEVAVEAPGEDFGDAVGGAEFALGGDDREQSGGVPAVGLGVVEALGDRVPGRVGGQGGAVVVAECGGGGGCVALFGVLAGGVQVAGDQGG